MSSVQCYACGGIYARLVFGRCYHCPEVVTARAAVSGCTGTGFDSSSDAPEGCTADDAVREGVR